MGVLSHPVLFCKLSSVRISWQKVDFIFLAERSAYPPPPRFWGPNCKRLGIFVEMEACSVLLSASEQDYSFSIVTGECFLGGRVVVMLEAP